MTPPASPGQPGGKHSHPSRLKIAVFLLLCITGGQSLFCRDPDESSIRIASYNVENYAVIPRPDDAGILRDAGKPVAARDAVARMIADLHPDILGLMEIGEPQQFEDLRARLKKAGVDYPFAEYLQGSDPVRHLALLSRFPITARHSEGDVSVSVDGIPLHSPRGILDVTLEPVPGKSLRVLCVHLKAKIGVPEYDESRLREAEASHLRKHVREILRKEPSAGIVLMGDFNDAPDSRTLREVEGKPEWADALLPLSLTDDRGESWTERWDSAEVYSRIDYILVSHSLEKCVEGSRSGIFRPAYWKEASDHCPVFTTLKSSDSSP